MLDILIALAVVAGPAAAVGVILWTVVTWIWRRLDAAAESLIPAAADVADAEAELPELRDRAVVTDEDIAWMHAAGDYRRESPK